MLFFLPTAEKQTYKYHVFEKNKKFFAFLIKRKNILHLMSKSDIKKLLVTILVAFSCLKFRHKQDSHVMKHQASTDLIPFD